MNVFPTIKLVPFFFRLPKTGASNKVYVCCKSVWAVDVAFKSAFVITEVEVATTFIAFEVKTGTGVIADLLQIFKLKPLIIPPSPLYGSLTVKVQTPFAAKPSKLVKDSNIEIQMNAYKTLEILFEEFEKGELDLDI